MAYYNLLIGMRFQIFTSAFTPFKNTYWFSKSKFDCNLNCKYKFNLTTGHNIEYEIKE